MRTTITLGVALALLAGCGGGGSEGPSAGERRAAAERKAKAEKRQKRERCGTVYADLHGALDELDSRLAVGLSYDEYTTSVGDVRVAYDQADFSGGGDIDCLTNVGVRLERAMNHYARAAGTWQECFDDIDCSNDSIQPQLQSRWSRAGAQLDRVDRYLP